MFWLSIIYRLSKNWYASWYIADKDQFLVSKMASVLLFKLNDYMTLISRLAWWWWIGNRYKLPVKCQPQKSSQKGKKFLHQKHRWTRELCCTSVQSSSWSRDRGQETSVQTWWYFCLKIFYFRLPCFWVGPLGATFPDNLPATFPVAFVSSSFFNTIYSFFSSKFYNS